MNLPMKACEIGFQTAVAKVDESCTNEPTMLETLTVESSRVQTLTNALLKAKSPSIEHQKPGNLPNEAETVETQENDTQIVHLQVKELGEDLPQSATTTTFGPHHSVHHGNEIHPSSSLPSDHQTLVLWSQPGLTLLYFVKELFLYMQKMCLNVARNRRVLRIIFSTLIVVVYLTMAGSNHPTIYRAQKKILWCLYWFSLGILSSVGLGAGIHTFALYLGPYIASVTVAMGECGHLDSVEDSLPGLECPQDPDTWWAPTLWSIMCKVRLESYMWGLGTAVGELPPFFMGRAARLSGQAETTDLLRDIEELQRKKDESPESLSRLSRIKLLVKDLVVKAGFWGILVCASIPNPFFNLAGYICGNVLVPFSTFFGATLVGKAFIKTTIQQVVVILSFNKVFLAGVVDVLPRIPFVGERFQTYLSQYMARQKEKFNNEHKDESTISSVIIKTYHSFVICTFLYFTVSIINSMAQNHHRRIKRDKTKKND